MLAYAERVGHVLGLRNSLHDDVLIFSECNTFFKTHCAFKEGLVYNSLSVVSTGRRSAGIYSASNRQDKIRIEYSDRPMSGLEKISKQNGVIARPN